LGMWLAGKPAFIQVLESPRLLWRPFRLSQAAMA
jgi:hypothetical protein